MENKKNVSKKVVASLNRKLPKTFGKKPYVSQSQPHIVQAKKTGYSYTSNNLSQKNKSKTKFWKFLGIASIGLAVVVGSSVGAGFGISSSRNFVANSTEIADPNLPGIVDPGVTPPTVTPPTVTPPTVTPPAATTVLEILRTDLLPNTFGSDVGTIQEIERLNNVFRNNNQAKLNELRRYYSGSGLTLENLENFTVDVRNRGEAIAVSLTPNENFAFTTPTEVFLFNGVIKTEANDSNVDGSGNVRIETNQEEQSLFESGRDGGLDGRTSRRILPATIRNLNGFLGNFARFSFVNDSDEEIPVSQVFASPFVSGRPVRPVSFHRVKITLPSSLVEKGFRFSGGGTEFIGQRFFLAFNINI